MGATKSVLEGWMEKLFFRASEVRSVEEVGRGFRRIALSGEALRGVRWTPGDKVQVRIVGAGMRTYTPSRWNVETGETELIAYLHGDHPAARWARHVRTGEQVHFFGPRGSLVVGGRQIVFGDETSLGLALAHRTEGPAVLEVTDPSDSDVAVRALRLTNVQLVARAPDGQSHLLQAVDALVRAQQANPDSTFVFSGRAAAIQGVRQALKARGVNLGSARSKAYWAPGKVGLD